MMNESMIQQSDNAFWNHPGKIDFLILGASHSLFGINENARINSFNFASGGENYVQTYYKLKLILEKREDDICTIILPLDLASFRDFHSSTFKQSNYWTRYVDFYEMGQLQGDVSSSLAQKYKAVLFPYFDGHKTVTRYFTGVNMENYSTGDFSIEPNKEQRALQTAQKHIPDTGQPDSITILYLKKIIALTQAYKKPIIFIKYPLSKAYYGQALTLMSVTDYDRETEEIALISNTHIFDYSRAFFNHDEYFKDSHHLNPTGRIKLTELFLTDLAEIE